MLDKPVEGSADFALVLLSIDVNQLLSVAEKLWLLGNNGR